jgi:hypothetical protein
MPKYTPYTPDTPGSGTKKLWSMPPGYTPRHTPGIGMMNEKNWRTFENE